MSSYGHSLVPKREIKKPKIAIVHAYKEENSINTGKIGRKK